MIQSNIDEQGIALITWNLPGRANVLNAGSMAAFAVEVEQALADAAVVGIVVASAKDHFILGGDLKEIAALPDVATTVKMGREFHRIFRRLETGGKPVAMAITGLALGGGLELCLAGHYRVALNSGKVQMGFPEVNLGLLPGAGGTQRFPRLVGLQAALLPLLTARLMRPAEALKLGLVNELAETPEAVLDAARAWILGGGAAVQPWDVRGFTTPGMDMTSAGTTFLYAGTAGMVRQKTGGNYPAANAILDCLYEGLQMAFDQALEVEIRHFAYVAQSKVARHMIRSLFFNMNVAKGGGARPTGFPGSRVEKLGVLGAGMMGAGIAYVSAKA
ncbi:MAG TPA: 3-hydroxyacyl-CoA dehydrogenase, partial [Bacteroidetes bacterium]|nr:3-hydroxyacyl-CoA dehydrogenase [Bacteroidota bacterium]